MSKTFKDKNRVNYGSRRNRDEQDRHYRNDNDNQRRQRRDDWKRNWDQPEERHYG